MAFSRLRLLPLLMLVMVVLSLGAALRGQYVVAETSSPQLAFVRTISGGFRGLTTSPNGASLYVSTPSSVLAYDTTTWNLLATIPICPNSTGMATSVDGKYLYVASACGGFPGNLTIIRTSDNAILTVLHPSPVPWAVAASPDGQYVFITDDATGGSTVAVLRTSDNTITTYISGVGSRAHGVAFTPDGQFAYVSSMADGTLSVIQMSTMKVIQKLPLSTGSLSLEGVAVSPDGRYVYVTDFSYGVRIINVPDNSLVGTIPLSGEAESVAFSADGTYAYVTAGYLYIIHTADLTVVQTVNAGDPPWSTVAVAPTLGQVYVSNEFDGTTGVFAPPPRAAQLAFTTQPPASTTIGQQFTTTVAVEDVSGNSVTTDSTTYITLTASSGSGTLTCTTDPVTDTAGVASFTCSIDQPGTYMLHAAANGLTGADSSLAVVPAGDMSVTGTVSPNPVASGHDLAYTFTVANQGPSPTTGVTLTETLSVPASTSPGSPPLATLVSITSSCILAGSGVGPPPAGTKLGASNLFTCAIGSVAASTSVTITLVIRPHVPDGTNVTDAATVSADQADPSSDNNTASLAATIGVNPPATPVITSLGCASLPGITGDPNTTITGDPVTCTPVITGTVTSRTWTASGGTPVGGGGASFTTHFSVPPLESKTISLKACDKSLCTSLSQTITVNPCQCVDYIRHRFHLTSEANAKDMGPILTAPGSNQFRQLGAGEQAKPGDVVIIDPAFFGSGCGDPCIDGHIAVVSSIHYSSSGTLQRLMLEGANQQPLGTNRAEGCTNVNILPFSIQGGKYFTFYRTMS